jgi:hypothetical protein
MEHLISLINDHVLQAFVMPLWVFVMADKAIRRGSGDREGDRRFYTSPKHEAVGRGVNVQTLTMATANHRICH